MVGLVIVRVLVDSSGFVERACATSGPAELRKPAEAAALQWRFQTVELNGRPVPYVEANVSFKFVLDGVDKARYRAEEFIWMPAGKVIGRLRVPAGFKVEVYDYREGTVTTLHYADGADIVLQVGGMYRIPMFQDQVHELITSRESPEKVVRTGRFRDTQLRWREDNYRPRKLVGRDLSLMQVFPPNVGYRGVSPSRRAEFDDAMDSFVREVDRGAGSTLSR